MLDCINVGIVSLLTCIYEVEMKIKTCNVKINVKLHQVILCKHTEDAKMAVHYKFNKKTFKTKFTQFSTLIIRTVPNIWNKIFILDFCSFLR